MRAKSESSTAVSRRLLSLDYVEGANLIVWRYSAEGHHERYADLAREIMSLRPEASVTVSTNVLRTY